MKHVFVVVLLGWLSGCASAQPKEAPSAKGKLECATSGCNGEICTERGKKMISPCVILPQHECLKKSRCEVQETEKCGWTKTPEYLECMKKFGGK